MQNLADKPLAIVGMACRLPGADDLEQFWQLLIEGRSDLGELPRDRFKRELHYHPEKGKRTKSYTSIGGVASHHPFDRTVNPLPQELIDRAHQVHLTFFEVAAAACRDAGWDPFDLPTRRAGVYTGHTPPCALTGNVMFARQVAQTAQYLREVPDFGRMPRDEQDAIIGEIIAKVRGEFSPDDKSFETQANAFHAAALVAEGMQLDGPAMSFDAACASAMRALGHGVRALQLGQIDMAIVGGASLCHCDTLILFSQAQSVTPTLSRPFDTNADGLVAAEGYVALVIKTLEKALADGDDIKAVIRGVGISSDGKGKSLWAPREEGQVEAIRRAYGPGVAIEDLQYIEMHATSTQVGDATEIGALSTVFADRLPPGMKFPVGSVKANVGHTLETAGLASLCKTVLAMRHGFIPPQINVTTLNEKIDWPNIPFYIPQQALPWPEPAAGKPRRAAVNTFGIGGLNVHVVLDEYTPAVHDSLIAPPQTALPADQVRLDEPIAVIGMGAVFAGAHTIDALFDVLRAGTDQKHSIPDPSWSQFVDVDSAEERRWRVPLRHGGFVTDFTYDWRKHRVPPKQIAGADPMQFMLLDAADQAIRDAGYMDKEFDHLRTGVIVGTIFGGTFTDNLQMGLRLPDFKATLTEVLRRRGVPDTEIEHVYQQYEDVLLKHAPALIDETGSFTSSTLASRITKTFNLMGGAVAVDAGDASAFSALNSCIDLLRAGDCDMMLCAAGQTALTCATYAAMAKNGFLADGEARAPFDAASTGCEPGEGVGVVVLKRLSDAQRDGDRIHAIIRGIGVARNDSLEQSVRSAIERGLADAHVSSNEVALVEAGAVGVPSHDLQEFDGVADVFGRDPREAPLLIGAVAGQFGYTGGVSGMAALMKSIAELNAVAVPKNAGLEQPAESVTSRASVLRPAMEQTRLPALNEDGRVIAGVNSYSQFNTAYHLVVEGMTKVPREKSAPPRRQAVAETLAAAASAPDSWRIARIGAASVAALKEQAAHAATQAVALYEASASSSFRPEQKHRLAVVCDSAETLAQKLALAAKQLDRPEARVLLGEKGIFVGEVGPQSPRIAFVFPGQGSQYEGMLKQLVDEYPPARAALRDVDNVFTRLGLPTFAELTWDEGERPGNEVWRTQLSLLAADTVMFAAATAMGLKPDRVAGHSFGELVALHAAGCWDFESTVRATCARCAAIDQCKHANGALLSTSAPAEVLHRLCEEAGGAVFISHYNAPDQTVAGGDVDAIARLAKIVDREGHKSLLLDVPAAFHTELMEEVKEPFGRALADLMIEPPRIPILSSVTNRYVADPADILDNLVVQMTQPVHYADLVQRLAAEGTSVFVEVGPRQVLTGLNRRTLGDAGPALVSCDHSKRQGLQQLLFARACVETTGALDSEPAPRQTHDAATAKEATPVEQPDVAAHEHPGLNVLRLNGTPYEMGKQHGRAHADEIRLILRRYADLVGTKWDQHAELDAAVAEPRVYFGEQDLEELKGIADGAGVTLASVIAHNLRLYLDAGSGGLHFAISAESNPGNGLLHAANEDLRRGLSIRDCLARNVQVRIPAKGIAHVTFGVVGQLGGLNGINAAGIAVSTSSLLDASHEAHYARGTLHTILVKNILENAVDIDAAVEIIRKSHGRAAFSVCLSHHAADRICYVEFDGRNLKVLPSTSAVVAANHSVLHTFDGNGSVPEPSRLRLNRLKDLLGGERLSPLTVSQAQQALRDRFDLRRGRQAQHPTASTVQRVDNQISLVMQPALGHLWVTAGPLSNGHQNQFALLKLQDLLPTVTKDANNNGAAVHSSPVSPSVITREALVNAYATAERARSSDANPPVCCRYVMRVIEQPLGNPATAALPLHGAAIVLGSNAVADALRKKLQERGAVVYQLPAANSIDAVLAAVDAAFASSPCPHLFITTACDTDAVIGLDRETWNHRRDRGAMLPYLVAQRWFQRVLEAGLLDRASIVAATTMGGDFGFSGQLNNVESGALTGLLKGIALELEIARGIKNLNMKLVDVAPSADAAKVADLLRREFAAGDGEKEVGYCDGRRYVVRPVPEPIVDSACSDLPAGVPFVITGGARGVTAVVARELGRRFGVVLHLIGSSPLPEIADTYHTFSEAEMKEVRAAVMKEALANGEKPVEAWERFEKALEIDKTLRSFAAEGIRATYHVCDVSDRAALARLLEEIRAADGPIHGVIHGAGFERAASFEKKNPQLVSRTIAAKVDGAAALMELTRRDPLKYFAAFGSVSGRFGGVGQTDYCTANEMLAKLVDWYRHERPDCNSTVFHWHAWDDVGMAVRPESKHIRKLHNINFMPSAEGAVHLIDELRAGLPEGEIVITELAYCKQKYADALAAAECGTSNDVGSLPMIDAVVESAPGESLTAEVHLDPTADLFLLQHRYKGAPMMPVVMTLEAMAEAASLAAGGKHVAGLKNIEIVNGLRFLSNAVQAARIRAAVSGHEVTCDFTCDFHNRTGKLVLKDKPYLRCTVETAYQPAPLQVESHGTPREWVDCWYPEEDVVIWHGPEFRCLRQIAVEEDRGWGRLVAPEIGNLGGSRTGEGWKIPTALLDSCFFACGVYLWFRCSGVVAIPAGIDRIRLGRQPRSDENCIVEIGYRGREGDQGIFDFTIFGEDHTAILQLEGYRNIIVSEAPAADARATV
ncbi:MAG: C45 family autoproteolytic acyltransferase/hydrolase [Planctomycetaceae bacterium]